MDDFEKFTLDYNDKSKKFTKSFIDNLGLVMGAIIVMAVIVIMTTDLRLISPNEIESIFVDLCLLIFCSYSMYICCADTGTKNGLMSTSYTEAKNKVDQLKGYIVSSRKQGKLPAFCKKYVEDELIRTKTYKLSTIGIDYDDYVKEYMYRDDEYIDALPHLSKMQKSVIKETNAIVPIRLNPEMLMGGIREKLRRSPLEVNPKDSKKLEFAVKFFQISAISLIMSVIAFDVVADPSWAVFASVCMKLVNVITNGFAGYKTGYDNIVIDTTNYIESQCNVLQQAIQFIEVEEVEEAARAMCEPLPSLTAPTN